eukprot:GGOE01044774.1.p1 GENE.GGOE01044774.1~~GGOE01044774.1.p1  ORF type:complete len:792 (-),score=212.25 GGOE01044774.1:81-2456(-)
MAAYGTFPSAADPPDSRSLSTPLPNGAAAVCRPWWVADTKASVHRRSALGRAHQPRWQAHRFTATEQKQMAEYESLGLHTPINHLYRAYLRCGGTPATGKMWWLMGLLGLAIALLCALVKQSLQLVMLLKLEMVDRIMSEPAPGSEPFLRLLGGMLLLNLALALAASLAVVLIAPQAAGSGMPEALAALNGVDLPAVFNARTLAIKVISLILAICSGLPIGLQGPIIHIGAQVGHLLSSSYRLWDFHDVHRRADFISAGVATAVAAAFGAPIGGLLLVVEAVASWWDMKVVSVMILFASLTCFFFSQLLEGAFVGFRPTENLGYLGNGQQVGSSATFHMKSHALVILPAVVLGVLCGLLSSAFIIGNLGVARLRRKYIGSGVVKRVGEVCVLALLFTSLSVGLPRLTECEPNYDRQSPHARWGPTICPDPDQFNPLAALSLHSGREVIDRLFASKQHDHPTAIGPFPLSALTTYFLLYFTFAMLTAGSAISSGMVVPSLVMGALTGRIFAIVCSSTLHLLGLEVSWIDPGVFAYVGAGAFLAGIMRLTFSMVAIMVEVSGDVSHLFPLMVTIYTANLVANRFTHSLNQSLQELRCMPVLEDTQGLPEVLRLFPVSRVMARPPVTVPRLTTVGRLQTLLVTTTHCGFPVVEASNGSLLGLVTRQQLKGIVAHPTLVLPRALPNPQSEDAPRELTYQQVQKLLEQATAGGTDAHPAPATPSVLVDLALWMDASPFTVQHDFSLGPAVQLFRQMGVRHLVVLDGRRVVGMVTRKDLLPQNLESYINDIDITRRS